MTTQTVLVAGGAGYIGSHFCHVAAQHGLRPVIVDRIEPAHARVKSYRLASSLRHPLEVCDIGDEHGVSEVLARYNPCAAVCFAGLIDVEQSTREPELYWDYNYEKVRRFVGCLVRADVRHLVFSSTAAVYRSRPDVAGLHETDTLAPTNPYGLAKVATELFLQGRTPSHNVAPNLHFPSPVEDGPAELSTVVLRYFNAAGAAPEFDLGEMHHPETHLIPNALAAIHGSHEGRAMSPLTINGDDYPTPDGTCVRDYVHVLDLAEAHVRAIRYLLAGGASDVFNLGSGTGASVKQVVAAIEQATGLPLPFHTGPRRVGDSPRLVADISKAARVLEWQPKFQLADIIASAALFNRKHPVDGL